MLRKTGLRKAFLATGLAAAVFGCNNVVIEKSEPTLTNVEISQEYEPPYARIELRPRLNLDGDLELAPELVTYPAEFTTKIRSPSCVQVIKRQDAYDFFQKRPRNTQLQYVNIFRNSYEKDGTAKSEKTGREFVIPLEKQ